MWRTGSGRRIQRNIMSGANMGLLGAFEIVLLLYTLLSSVHFCSSFPRPTSSLSQSLPNLAWKPRAASPLCGLVKERGMAIWTVRTDHYVSIFLILIRDTYLQTNLTAALPHRPVFSTLITNRRASASLIGVSCCGLRRKCSSLVTFCTAMC